ncbi:hypothetical protein DICSQDRAFT_80777 [Dichomitus squalens LYAD-421 SS1]|uniref:uncharacterized protein n=1 Tax=Dichomitus squalens (strain LYAD-421) TaxID=732165 RepID=UPI0004411224|nr:uncharacterized protein DICSQDRAFT_80777 [Dichomitus squalens LYAD-421 SS1]EJF64937.1 hypothetical protein DICSQDRAFT_80777 [Dichomitus squalens LYAD-421 SS1]
MFIHLPEDVWLDVFRYLEVQDVLTLRKTCRTLHILGGNDYVWHRLIAEFPLPIDVPFDTRPTALPADELQRLAIKAIRLDANWRSPKTRVKRTRALLNDKSGQYVDHMQFLPGGKWLWTAQRTLKREATYTRMNLWSLDDVDNARRVWSAEVSGIYRSCTVVQTGEDDFATLVAGVCDQREVIEIHKISLEDSPTNFQYGLYHPNYPLYQPPAPVKSRQLQVVPHPRAPHLRPIISEIAGHGGVLIVTVFALDTGGGAGSLQIMFVNPETGATKWIDPSFAQPFSFLWVRVWGEYLFLIGQVDEDFVVRAYRMPQPFPGSPSRTPRASPPRTTTPLQEAEEDEYAYTDLGPVVAQFVGPTPMAVPRHHIPHVSFAVAEPSLSAIMFYHSSQPHRAQLLRFSFDVSGEGVTLSDMSSKDFHIGDESSPQLAQVGALGFRAVWLEHNWETQQNRVMKLAFDPHTGAAKVGMLIPPDPELPFTPNMCHSLAFDEVTGRLCLAMYDGNVYLLDFV